MKATENEDFFAEQLSSQRIKSLSFSTVKYYMGQ